MWVCKLAWNGNMCVSFCVFLSWYVPTIVGVERALVSAILRSLVSITGPSPFSSSLNETRHERAKFLIEFGSFLLSFFLFLLDSIHLSLLRSLWLRFVSLLLTAAIVSLFVYSLGWSIFVFLFQFHSKTRQNKTKQNKAKQSKTKQKSIRTHSFAFSDLNIAVGIDLTWLELKLEFPVPGILFKIHFYHWRFYRQVSIYSPNFNLRAVLFYFIFFYFWRTISLFTN